MDVVCFGVMLVWWWWWWYSGSGSSREGVDHCVLVSC